MAITDADLFKQCDTCGGKGNNRPPDPPSSGSSFGRRVITTYGDFTCQPCHGTGIVLTESGKAIADVVKHLEGRAG